MNNNTQLTAEQKLIRQLKELSADPKGQCSICGRRTWKEEDSRKPCDIVQPDGTKCKGIFLLYLV